MPGTTRGGYQTNVSGGPAAVQTDFRAKLQVEQKSYVEAALAKATQAKVVTAMRNYASFCDLLGYEPHLEEGGISNPELELYITWMARTLQPDTIGAYLSNGIRHLTEASGIKWVPPSERYSTERLMRGIKRTKGTAQPNRKHAVTLPLLRRMATLLDLNDPNDQMFWTVCVFLFFTFLRKGHAMVKSAKDHGPAIILKQDLAIVQDEHFVLTVHHTKTVQFQQRILKWLLPRLEPGDVCCPTTQLARYMAARPDLTASEPLFQTQQVDPKTGQTTSKPLRYEAFIAKFKGIIAALGLNPAVYSGHSFRRGGATFARDAGINDEVIKAMGDWKSEALLTYISATQRLRVKAAGLLARAVRNADTAPPLLDLDD